MASPLRILIVDDDTVDRLAVRRLLSKTGFDVETEECADERSARTAMLNAHFDCVLLDYHLPGQDGISVLRQLRNGGNNVPVVALTGQGDEEVAVELMKAGAADYLNKNGLTPERLQRSLRYALALHRAEEERRLLLEREQQARLEAQAANRAKDEFLATLSHELRTPLNAILGWTRLLSSGHLDQATSRRAIDIIERNTRLQAQLIEELLDISRIVTGKLRLEFSSVPALSIVEAAVDSVRPSADAKQLRIDTDLSAAADPILCDPARIQQIVWNLLSNAIKFTKEGGRVRVAARREDGVLMLEVSDTGVGIDPDFLPYVFDRFRQQDAATTRSHGGLGLGLAIVRHLVELHGGTVEAHSGGVGQGASFLVTLPVAPARASQAPPVVASSGDAALSELPTLGGLRVLVVEDEPDGRALVCAVLEGFGATVVAAGSVADALQEIERARPDVLLSDIAMPGEDGYSLIRRVRMLHRSDPPIPAAALTAFATASDRARALLAGYQAHIPKPVEPSELAAVVATLAGRTAVRN
jgi:signal transduction histidine kinase